MKIGFSPWCDKYDATSTSQQLAQPRHFFFSGGPSAPSPPPRLQRPRRRPPAPSPPPSGAARRRPPRFVAAGFGAAPLLQGRPALDPLRRSRPLVAGAGDLAQLGFDSGGPLLWPAATTVQEGDREFPLPPPAELAAAARRTSPVTRMYTFEACNVNASLSISMAKT